MAATQKSESISIEDLRTAFESYAKGDFNLVRNPNGDYAIPVVEVLWTWFTIGATEGVKEYMRRLEKS